MNFSIKPEGSQQPSPFPMVPEPSQLVIPANETCFMAVHFSPTAIRSYSAILEAVVEYGGEAAGGNFRCAFLGEGTLPSITVELPQSPAEKGPPAIRFPRLLKVSPAVTEVSQTQKTLQDRFTCSLLMPTLDTLAMHALCQHTWLVGFVAFWLFFGQADLLKVQHVGAGQAG